MQTGKNGDPNTPVPWPTFPQFLTAQPGFIASPTWLAAVEGNADLATKPVGTGPFTVQEFINGDRMTVVKNPNYWRKDAKGGQLPYLDSIEFRVIPDAQVRDQALQAGDIDLQATSDGNVVSKYVDSTDPVMLQQDTYTETNYTMFHLTKPQLDRPGRALRADPGRRPPGPRRRHRRRLPEARQRPVLAGSGRLPRRQRPARSSTPTRRPRRSPTGRRRTVR